MEARQRAVADQTEPPAVRFAPSAGAGTDARSVCPRQRRRSPARLRLRGINPPVGCKQARPSSKPFAASAISPGPFRGWGRHPLACIHTQREPVVSPAGTGTEYRRPQAVSWHLAALRAKASGDRSRMDANTSISGTASSAIRWSNDLLALWPSRASRTRTPVQKGTRAGESRGVREVCPAVGSSRRGRGRLERQFALGRRRAVLEVRPDAPRLPAAASSIGSVPLQSG